MSGSGWSSRAYMNSRSSAMSCPLSTASDSSHFARRLFCGSLDLLIVARRLAGCIEPVHDLIQLGELQRFNELSLGRMPRNVVRKIPHDAVGNRRQKPDPADAYRPGRRYKGRVFYYFGICVISGFILARPYPCYMANARHGRSE